MAAPRLSRLRVITRAALEALITCAEDQAGQFAAAAEAELATVWHFAVVDVWLITSPDGFVAYGTLTSPGKSPGVKSKINLSGRLSGKRCFREPISRLWVLV